MDMSTTIITRSDQQNYDDYIAGPKTVTIADVTEGTPEQPVNIELVEYPGKPYKPSKSMRRVLVAAWGKDSTVYKGRKLELFGNPEIRFGKEAVGGIQIARMSHLDAPVTVPLTVSRGKKKAFTVQPLLIAPSVTVAQVEACNDLAELKKLWHDATPEVRETITARAETLKAAGDQE